MITKVPPAFKMTFCGPEGQYRFNYAPIGEWDGQIDVMIADIAMSWPGLAAHQDDGGKVALGGSTTGSKEIWGDTFWFELRYQDDPPIVRYWADRVIWREDNCAETNPLAP